MPSLVCALLSSLLLCVFFLPVVESHDVEEGKESVPHVCGHHDVMKELKEKFPENFQPIAKQRKRSIEATEQNTWGKLRIKWDFSFFEKSAEADFVRTSLLPQAAQYLSQLLSVKNIQGPLKFDRPCSKVFSQTGRCAELQTTTLCGQDVQIPSVYFDKGVTDTDLVIFPKMQNLDGTMVANAHVCMLDTSRRPTNGRINLSPRHFAPVPVNSKQWKYLFSVILHELTHVLGFTADLFPGYRKPDGKPYPNGVLTSQNLRDNMVFKIVTPTVVAQAQKYFNCPNLNGVELENGGSSASVKSHWESRLFKGDYMVAAMNADDDNLVGPLTVALLEDSGWYKGNYAMTSVSAWGKNRGCDFTTKKCVEKGVSNFPSNFCSQDKQHGCLPSGLARGMCTFTKWNPGLPAQYQYFSDQSLGGASEFMDFCPYLSKFTKPENKGSDCTDPANLPSLNSWGEIYGPTSRCFESTLIDSTLRQFNLAQGTACYKMECTSNKKLMVTVGKTSIDCTNPQAVTVQGFRGQLNCPGYRAFCS